VQWGFHQSKKFSPSQFDSLDSQKLVKPIELPLKTSTPLHNTKTMNTCNYPYKHDNDEMNQTQMAQVGSKLLH
jgi:hypothetical protein